MAGQMFMRVDEVAEELGVSKPYCGVWCNGIYCRPLRRI